MTRRRLFAGQLDDLAFTAAGAARFSSGLSGSPYGMPVVVTIGVVSVLAATLMIRSAITVGFGAFVVPIVLAEALFLGAVYLIWQGLGGGEHAAEGGGRPRPDTGRRRAESFEPPSAAQRAARHGLGGRSLVGRTGG